LTKRIKKRYLAVIAEPRAEPDEMMHAIISSYEDLFGKFGLASAGIKLVKSYPSKGILIVRCFLDSLPRLILALASITKIGEERTALRIISISGTIKSLTRKLSSPKRT